MNDCKEHTDEYPKIAAPVTVRANREIASGVYELVVERKLGLSGNHPGPSFSPSVEVPSPRAGQFFMLRARPSGVLLGRPISVYVFDDATITFLILKKGAGTVELCALRAGDSLDIVGPIGNRFMLPDEIEGVTAVSRRIAIIGGGIGVAPVAGFSRLLAEKSFDFYASFRSEPYGLELAESRAARLVVTTEDGSSGVKGMLPAVFDPARYDLVYACGPTPMLRYIKDACAGGPIAFISLEEHMACGAGACLGCTVRTVNGNKRCCVDGPVFNAAEVLL